MGLDTASSGDSLDPALYPGNYMEAVGLQLYNTLCEVDEHGKVQPSLAESWEARRGAAVWIIRIRKGVFFHNGKEMTAADVVYSLNHHRSKDSKSAAKPFLEPIKELLASDRHEVTITLDAGNVDFPYILGDYRLVVAPVGDTFDKGIGTGAFILKSFTPGVKTETHRNPNYWNSGKRGWVDSVTTLAINDPTARANALQSGAVHLADRISPNIAFLLRDRTDLQIHNYRSAGFCCFPMRTDTPPFDDNDVRLAIKFAIDRDKLVRTMLHGYGTIGNDNPLSPFDEFYAADIPQRPHDPDKARFHIKKSGYSGPIRLSVADTAFQGAVGAAELMQASMAEAGIQLDVTREPSDGYWDSVWRKKDFCAGYWSGRPTADMMLSIAYKSNAPWNETFWSRPRFDELLASARSELDVDKRRQMYHDLQLMIVNDGGELIPMFNNYIEGTSSTLRGYVPVPYLEVCGLRAAEMVWFDV